MYSDLHFVISVVKCGVTPFIPTIQYVLGVILDDC